MKNTKKNKRKNQKKTKKRKENYYTVKHDVWGKRLFIPLEAKRAMESIDRLNRASDFKKNDKRRYWFDKEYRRRMLLQVKKSRKSRKIYSKKTRISNNYKTIKKSIKKIPIKKLEDIYYHILFEQ